jgi:deoxycytidine triphosphate deaminase
MLMNDAEILKAIEKNEMAIRPFEKDNLKGASYDLSIGGEALVSNRDEKVILAPTGGSLKLEAGDFALVLTRESVRLPLNIAGLIGMRSSLARSGLILLHGMQIDPGWDGHLRFGLYNASPRKITLDYGDDICMIELHKMAGNATKAPPHNDDLIKGRIPESDKQFLRMLETTSLSTVAQEMRTMSINVSELTRQMTSLARTQNKFIIPGIIAIFASVVAGIILALITALTRH